jgi:maltose-binding protein MalE
MSFWVNGATQLNIWHMSKEMDVDFAATASAFSALHPDINVSVHFFPNEELKSSAIRASDQKNAPDIIIISSDNVGYAKLMRLSELPTDMVDSTMPAATVQALQFKNRHYSIPLFAGNHLLMFYNKALVKSPATEWQQLITQHDGFRAQGVETLAINYQEPYWFSLFVSLFGAELTQNDNVSLNTDAMRQALQFYRQLGESGVANMQCDYRCVSEGFYQGRFAYAINGTWALAAAKERLGSDFGMILFPPLQGRQIKPLASYIVMVFPNQSLSSEKAPQIKQLVTFFRRSENLDPIAEKHYMTTFGQNAKADLPSKSDTNDLYSIVMAQRKLTQLMPSSAAMVSVWNGMQKGMMLYQNKTLDASAAADFMQKLSTRDHQLLEAGL